MAKKTTKKTAKQPHLIPQPNGKGALMSGGTPGNKGGGRHKDFATELYEATGHTEEYYLKKADAAADKGDWRAVQYILDRLYGKIPDMTIIVKKIQVDVIHRIGAMLPQAMLQAGVPKKQVNEALTNFNRLLEAGE